MRREGERGDEGGQSGEEMRKHGCEETDEEVEEPCFISVSHGLGEVRG